MARIRSIKPEFWTDRKLSRLSRDARLLYVSLWNQSDEWGRLHGDTRFIKGHCLPYDDDLSLRDIDALLTELADAGRVQRYEVDGDPFLFLPKIDKHQRLEPAKVPSRLPAPPDPHDPPPPAHKDEPREDKTEIRATSSEPRADSPETNVALQVAGSRVQVASGREQGSLPRLRGEAADFPEWYAAYPVHKGRKAAAAAYVRALRFTDHTTLVAAAERLASDPTRDPAFTPHPATWLNQGRWEDEGPARPAAVNKSDERAARNLALIASFAEQSQLEVS